MSPFPASRLERVRVALYGREHARHLGCRTRYWLAVELPAKVERAKMWRDRRAEAVRARDCAAVGEAYRFPHPCAPKPVFPEPTEPASVLRARANARRLADSLAEQARNDAYYAAGPTERARLEAEHRAECDARTLANLKAAHPERYTPEAIERRRAEWAEQEAEWDAEQEGGE